MSTTLTPKDYALLGIEYAQCVATARLGTLNSGIPGAGVYRFPWAQEAKARANEIRTLLNTLD